MEIKIRVPRIPAGLVSNLVGVLGLLGFAVAVGGLTGSWWWALLVGSVQAVGLAYIAQTHGQAEPGAVATVATANTRPRVVKPAAEASSA